MLNEKYVSCETKIFADKNEIYLDAKPDCCMHDCCDTNKIKPASEMIDIASELKKLIMTPEKINVIRQTNQPAFRQVNKKDSNENKISIYRILLEKIACVDLMIFFMGLCVVLGQGELELHKSFFITAALSVSADVIMLGFFRAGMDIPEIITGGIKASSLYFCTFMIQQKNVVGGICIALIESSCLFLLYKYKYFLHKKKTALMVNLK